MYAWKTRRLQILAAALVSLAVFARNAGDILVVDSPQPSDIIVVLAGETDRRPAYGLELLDRGYARRMLLNVPAASALYHVSQIQLAQQYVHSLPEAGSIDICPVVGLSTRDESHDVEKCLAHQAGTRVLIVTSDFHTRRSLSIFRKELRGRTFSVAAVRDETQFGTRWWTHRQWAKTCVDEWLRWTWWNLVERWR
jgi:DUF218 domain